MECVLALDYCLFSRLQCRHVTKSAHVVVTSCKQEYTQPEKMPKKKYKWTQTKELLVLSKKLHYAFHYTILANSFSFEFLDAILFLR